ncbi:MAG: hypothetical protein ACKVZ6_02780, partial [Kineosporiaceae bacterium]
MDTRADQFAFCVALYEALAGERPFPTGSAEVLIEAVETGRLRGRAAFRASSAVHAVVARGLKAKPDDRWRDMEVLLAALQRARRPRRWWPAAVGVAAVGVSAWSIWSPTEATPACSGSAAELAPVWGDARRDAVHEALLSAQRANTDSAARTLAVIDAYAATWIEVRDAVCASPDAVAFDRAMQCLAERRTELASLTEGVLVAPQSAAPQTILDAYHLPAAARCHDAGYLAARVRPPADPALAAAVAVEDERLAEVEKLRASGKYEAGLALAREVRQRAEELGYDPLQAEALHYS